jgi:hypothetical protein
MKDTRHHDLPCKTNLSLSSEEAADDHQACRRNDYGTESSGRKGMRRCLVKQTQNKVGEEGTEESQQTNGSGIVMEDLKDAAEVRCHSMAGG